jgi:hypothetical protein
MEAMFSSETSVDFERITLHYIREDSTLHILYFPTIGSNMADARTCYMEAALGSRSDIEKCATFLVLFLYLFSS